MAFAGGGIWWWQSSAGGAAPTPAAPSKGGLPPQKIYIVDRKAKRRDEDEDRPKPPSVRETIERILHPEREQKADALDRSLAVAPIVPLTEAERAQVIAALMGVPERQLAGFGLEAAIWQAARLVRELEQDDEDALAIVLAVTLQ